MKLVHKSGAVSCNPNYGASNWGCQNPVFGNNSLMTIITNTNKESLLPPAEEFKTSSACDRKNFFYSLNGTTHTSPELVFSNLSNPLSVSRNQELQIWYGQDWRDCSENNNNGTACVDVYAWYA